MTLQNELASFCLITYNQENYIEDAIKGALSQTYPNLEIIISDDASTDGTQNLIKKIVNGYQGPHRIITNYNTTNLGLVRHVNKVLYEISTGTYVFLAAGDDISMENRVKDTIDFYKSHIDVVATGSDVQQIDDFSNKVDSPIYIKKTADRLLNIDYYLSAEYKHLYGCTRSLTRKLINSFPPLDDTCPTEDTTLLFRAFLLNKKVGDLKDILVQYRVHENNMSSPDNLVKLSIVAIFNQYSKDLEFAYQKKYISTKCYHQTKKVLSERLKSRMTGNGLLAKLKIKLLSSYKILFSKFFTNRMSKIINVFWYRHHEGNGNFGDELNPYLISKLSGATIVWASPFNSTKIMSVKAIVYMLVEERKSLKNIITSPAWKKLFNLPIIFAVGSIIRYCDTNALVWGSGVINIGENIPNATFLAVRGKYTQKRLSELRYKVPTILGDPGLLAPLVYKGSDVKKYKMGVIPHHIHYAELRQRIVHPDVLVINLLDSVEKVIDDICSCNLTLSTSLHGIIVSHAYGINSIWIRPKDLNMSNLAGDDIKFADYFSSVELSEYQPVEVDFLTFSVNEYLQMSQNLSEIALPSPTKISEIQKDLLSVAPFKLSAKFRR